MELIKNEKPKAPDFKYPPTKMLAEPKFHKEISGGFRDLKKFLPEYGCVCIALSPTTLYLQWVKALCVRAAFPEGNLRWGCPFVNYENKIFKFSS